MVRLTLDFTTDQGLPQVVQWLLYALEENPQTGTVLAEIHAGTES